MSHPDNPPPYEAICGQRVQMQPVQLQIQPHVISQQQMHDQNQSHVIRQQQMQGLNQPQVISQQQMHDQIQSQVISEQQMQDHNQCEVIIHVPYQPNSQIIYEYNLREVKDKDKCVTVCRNCHHTILTKTKMKPKIMTHACAASLFLIGFVPFCCMPYCMPSCNNVDHYCPKCNAYLGSYTG